MSPRQTRYLLPDDDVGPGTDQLLDVPVTISRIRAAAPERLARALRALPETPWLRVLDAFGTDGATVLVLPGAAQRLDELLEAGLPPARAQELAEALPPTLDRLLRLQLRVQSLDPARVPVRADGLPLLVPVPESAPGDDDPAGLLARLGRRPAEDEAEDEAEPLPGPAPTPPDRTAPRDGPASTRTTALPTVALPTAVPLDVAPAGPTADSDTPAPAAAAPPPALAPAGPRRAPAPRPAPVLPPGPSRRGRPSGSARRRDRSRHPVDLALGLAAAVLLAAAVTLLAVGLLVRSGGAPGDGTRATPPPATAPAPSEAAATLGAAERKLAAAPTSVGSGGPELLRALRVTVSADGAAQRFAAARLLDTARVGADTGTLRGPLVEGVARDAAVLARPADLAELVALTAVDPAAFGPGAAPLLDRLTTLRDRLRGEAARAEAQELWRAVQQGPVAGDLNSTYAELAVPVLRELAVPDDLAGLVAVTRVDPARFGPGAPALLRRLEGLQARTGAARRAGAAALLELVKDGAARGELTRPYADIAVPVLLPLARGEVA